MTYNYWIDDDLYKFLFYSLGAIILATLSYTLTLNSQPQLTIKAVKNKMFDDFYIIGKTFDTGNIADCLEHCLEDCRCQSFQICGETKCQLCSRHKEDNSSLLHDNDTCIYAMYEMRNAEVR